MRSVIFIVGRKKVHGPLFFNSLKLHCFRIVTEPLNTVTEYLLSFQVKSDPFKKEPSKKESDDKTSSIKSSDKRSASTNKTSTSK